ncbi:MAG TPA: SulP family inorganic anion transporter [Saprospiraceae bacterium]|nr:SulP family inorganic anion transporter [Saprospiraceae bacterium]
MEKHSFVQRIGKFVPIFQWLPQYEVKSLKWDVIAGITLASFVLPESMAYATLAGVPTYFGIYSCLAAGLFFAFFTTSRHVAVGPTSAISLMIGSTVAVLSGGDPQRWAEIAGLTALVVAGICFIAFIFKLSSLVNFISDSILLGFKAGAALSIMATQLPKLFGVEGGGSNFFTRIGTLVQHLPEMNWVVLCFGIAALTLLVAGDKVLPGRPVSLVVVVASIVVVSVTQLATLGIHVIGEIPQGLPAIARPSLRLSDVDGVLELAFACFLMGYIETISAARTFAIKNNYAINPRQELLSMGVANFAAAFSSAYVASGGLSQSTVNEKSGAKTPLSLIICSITLAVILLYFTGLLTNLPEVLLAAIVLHAVAGLIKVKELKNVFRLSKLEFGVAMIAFAGVLALGILKGVMLAVVMSLVLLIRRISHPHVALLGRIGDTPHYSDIGRHPDNVLFEGLVILRIESSILYFNAENIQEKIAGQVEAYKGNLKLVILDLSASSYVDVAGSKMLLQLSEQLHKKGIQLKIVEALSNVRDILRMQGMEEIIGHISRRVSVNDAVQEYVGNAGKS